uniref:Uncharacterized protein n=1 Tax=Fagus sylvatica TaxID=28930 RepID=A0A2N9HT46_FAGSY
MSNNRQGPPKHQNKFAWKPNAGCKINETEVGGRFRPLSEITGVCPRCRDQIEWKRRYGKYKTLIEPAKCQQCSKRNVRQAYHSLCPGCAKEQSVCAKCRCRVDRIVGRDLSEVEAEQKLLEETIKNARERDRRTLLRAVNKGKSKSSAETPTNDENEAGELFPNASLATNEENEVGESFPNASLDENAELSTDDNGDEEDDEDEDLVLN